MRGSNPHWRPIDDATGFEVLSHFRKFDQRDEIYCRSEWDPEVRSEKTVDFFRSYFMPNARARRTDGFSQRDYALRNAAWHVTNVLRDMHRETKGRKEGFFDHFSSHEAGWPEPCAFVRPKRPL
jgi:epoxyqueuosine reductase